MMRKVPTIPPVATLVLLAACAMPWSPSRAMAEGRPQMAPAPGMKGSPPTPGMKGEAQPGQWRDYDPSTARGPKGKAGQLGSGTLVVIAYIIIWAVVLLYVLVLAVRQRRLRAEVQQLRRRLDEVELPAPAANPEKT